jgi:hypothetical protein
VSPVDCFTNLKTAQALELTMPASVVQRTAEILSLLAQAFRSCRSTSLALIKPGVTDD